MKRHLHLPSYGYHGGAVGSPIGAQLLPARLTPPRLELLTPHHEGGELPPALSALVAAALVHVSGDPHSTAVLLCPL